MGSFLTGARDGPNMPAMTHTQRWLCAIVLAALLTSPSLAGAQNSAPSKEPPAASPGSNPGSNAGAGASAQRRPPAKPELSPAEQLKTLYGALAKAPDAASAEKIVQAVEQLWSVSGSPTADLILARAIRAAEAKKPDLAMQFLDRLTELNPEWPEAFNRRAFLYVMKQDYARALGDLRRVLALDPGNFRALEGLTQILRAMGQDKAALDAVRELIKVHPHSPGAADMLKDLERAVDGQGI